MPEGQYTTLIDQRFLNEVAPQTPGGTRLLLYDFETGRQDLLSRHREGLSRYVTPFLTPTAPPISVWIGGLASRRGGEQLNRGLAFARAMEVERFILSSPVDVNRLTSRHSLTTRYYGERYSTGLDENSAYYRSVLVVLSPPASYHATPRPPRQERLQVSTHFRILLSHSIEGGEYFAAGSYAFIIDYQLGASAPESDPVVYKLIAGGFGGGAPFGVGAGDPATDWNPFVSTHVTTARGFEGQARLAGWSYSLVGGRSGTYLRLMPAASEHGVLIDPFQSSWSASLGASIVQGPFRIEEGATNELRRGGSR